MSNIFIKIEKDANTVKYIKLIRDYDKTISIGDIKRFYKLVQELQKAGAIITVFDEYGDSGDILFLKRELDMCLGIIAETNRYLD